MLLSKAIELLSIQGTIDQLFESPDTADAIKLGIEALKRIENIRLHPGAPVYGPLPGETPRQ